MNMREPQATPQTQRVRASRNTLCEKDLFARHKECVSLDKATLSRLAQSSLFNVARQGVERGL
jgi:hypothetical protein